MHYGVNKTPISTLPSRILDTMQKVSGDHSLSNLISKGSSLSKYLFSRKAPMEDQNLREKIRELTEIVESNPTKYKLPATLPDPTNEQAVKFYNEMKRNRIETLMHQRVYAWQAIEYDEYKSLLYLFGRAPQEYASLIKIFKEIERRDTNFTPRTFFDFGSGVGTGVWAVSELWKQSLYEYYLVDASKYMNDLSDLILRDGDLNKNISLRNVYQRQFLPSRNQKYDIVLSAYSMFEQQNLKERLKVVNNLWNKTENYLIFVENGTNSGFQLLNEIREFLMDLKDQNNEKAFIFSPCPHNSDCPRFTLNDGTPCNFEVRYYSLPFSGPTQINSHTYSYLVIKKGESNDTTDKWPRIVRPTLVKSKHTICRMCTKDGNLEEVIFTQKQHGKSAYRCARHSSWGDQYPAESMESYIKETKTTRIREQNKLKYGNGNENEEKT